MLNLLHIYEVQTIARDRNLWGALREKCDPKLVRLQMGPVIGENVIDSIS